MKLHVARGDYLEKEMKDEQLIRSLLSKRDVRINIYKKKSGKVGLIKLPYCILKQPVHAITKHNAQ